MLQQTQRSLHNNILQDRAWWNIDGAAFRRHNDHGALESDATTQVHTTSNGEVVELEDLGDGGDARLEGGNFLEVVAELDERRWTEAVGIHHELAVLEGVEIRLDEHEIGAGLDGQEATTRDVDAVGIVEMADGGADGRLELDDADVRLALLVGWDGFAVGDDLHAELVVLHHALDGAEVHPDVVGVEVLELLDALELVDVLLGHLSDFEQAGLAFVVDDGATLHVCLRLVRQFHDVLCFCLHHVLQDIQVDDSAEVVGVGEEDDLNAAGEQLVEDAGVVEGFEDITMAWWVPVGDLRFGGLWRWEEGVLQDAWVFGLVEGHDVDVMALVLLDDAGCVGVGVEGVHEDEGDVDVVCAVEELDLADGQVEEGHAVTHFDNRLRTDAAHGGAETTIEFEHGELVQELHRLRVAESVVVDDLLGLGRGDARPLDLVALGLVVEVSAKEGEEVVHFRLESLSCCQCVSPLHVCQRPHTFLSLGSLTVSASELRALRIWEAATEVEVFSKA